MALPNTSTLPSSRRGNRVGHPPASIPARQNDPSVLRLFAAQRAIYSQAKTLHLARHTAAIALAGIAPILLILWPASTTALAVVGGLATVLLEGVLISVERAKIRTAATIQEEIDTGIFTLPWNRTLVGDRVRPEVISAAEREFRGNRETLRDWYADPADLPFPLDVLLCQRANLVWDSRLRRRYASAVAVATVGLFIAGIAVAWVFDQSFRDYLLAILLPSLPALVQGVRLTSEHTNTSAEKELVQGELGRLLENAARRPKSVTAGDCRALQDRIFGFRANGPLVPDWWYDRLRVDYDVDMRVAVELFRTELKAGLAATSN